MKNSNSRKKQVVQDDDAINAIVPNVPKSESMLGEIQIDSKLEKLIQDLEFKSLTLEISEMNLKQEIARRKNYEKEISLLNESLQEQATRLNDLNRELKTFTYTVSHDLKAPLRGILGYSQELLKRHSDKLTERPLFCVNQIATASQNLETLIDDLLTYSRLELEIPTSIEVNISELIGKLIKDRYNSFSQYKTNLELNIECEQIWCWERGFSQAMANLIDNAIKYSRNVTAPKVTINSSKRNQFYHIEVCDNGIGFDPQFSNKIFDLFHRLTTDAVFEGTGAGLAIVKKVIAKMDGKVWAESSEGKGATFFIEIPVK